MLRRHDRKKIHGLTLIEVLVVLAIISILAAVLVPLGIHERCSPPKLTQCMNNLKQIGLAEIIWADDHNDRFAATISTNQGGALEFLMAGRVDLHFKTLGTNLASVKLLCCPEDTREAASNPDALKNENISYFASLDPDPTNRDSILTGDRNLTINGQARTGSAVLTATNAVGWTRQIHNQKNATQLLGNLAFRDGHVSSVREKELSGLAAGLGTNVNRLVFP